MFLLMSNKVSTLKDNFSLVMLILVVFKEFAIHIFAQSKKTQPTSKQNKTKHVSSPLTRFMRLVSFW